MTAADADAAAAGAETENVHRMCVCARTLLRAGCLCKALADDAKKGGDVGTERAHTESIGDCLDLLKGLMTWQSFDI